MTTKTVAKLVRSYRHWSPTELQYLAENYGLICDKTLAARLQREESAIINIASRKRVASRMANFYTASTLARVLGIPCPKSVILWVKRGWLVGRKSAMSQGKKQLWRFSQRGVVRCLKQRPWLVDLKLMDRHYFRSVVIKEWERDPWYTAKQAAPLLGVKKAARVIQYIHRGWLRAEKKPYHNKGIWIIRRSAIETFLENDPRPRHKYIAAGAARRRFIMSLGEPSRLVIVWLIKCPSCGQQVTITASPQLRGPQVRERFIAEYVNGNCKHGAACLVLESWPTLELSPERFNGSQLSDCAFHSGFR